MYSRNSVGLSPPTQISVLVAQVPDKPLIPSTVYFAPNIYVTWSEPYNGAAPLLYYKVLFLETDGATFSLELSNCDGSNSLIM